jgi:hypothetical protein
VFWLKTFAKSFVIVVLIALNVFPAVGVKRSAIPNSAPVIWRSGNAIPTYAKLVEQVFIGKSLGNRNIFN